MTKKYRPLHEIVDDLPVGKGSVIWVTADLTRLAIGVKRKEGSFSADNLIDLLQYKVGQEGTLVIPAFNHNLKNKSTFDIRATRPITGALALTAFSRNDFQRTSHPLHSFMVWGKHAGELVLLDNRSSFGEGSPFEWLLAHGAVTLFIGTSVKDAFTFAHFAEEKARVHYRKYRNLEFDYVDSEGRNSRRGFSIYAKKWGWDMCLGRLEELLEEKNLIDEWIYNGVRFSMLSLQDVFDILMEDIKNNRARNLACFSLELYFREMVKSVLKNMTGYRTVPERIRK